MPDTRAITIFWEPGEEPSYDSRGWLPWELSALFYKCAEQEDAKIEAMAEAREDDE